MLITGANRGLGLEMVKQLLGGETGPELVFAGCRQPDSAQVGWLTTKLNIHGLLFPNASKLSSLLSLSL